MSPGKLQGCKNRNNRRATTEISTSANSPIRVNNDCSFKYEGGWRRGSGRGAVAIAPEMIGVERNCIEAQNTEPILLMGRQTIELIV